MVILEQAERDKFIAWLREQADSDDQLATQCERIGEATIARRLRSEAMAALIVAKKMLQTHSQTTTVG